MAESYDVVVIGAGPGGYIAAIRAAQLGFKVACIDDWTRADGRPAPGGTCTNVGCIPSKALLQSSEHYEQAGHHFAAHGIEVKGLGLDLAKMLARKDGGVEIKVSGAAEETLIARHVIVATGSNARALPGAAFDEKRILSNDGALAIPEVP